MIYIIFNTKRNSYVSYDSISVARNIHRQTLLICNVGMLRSSVSYNVFSVESLSCRRDKGNEQTNSLKINSVNGFSR